MRNALLIPLTVLMLTACREQLTVRTPSPTQLASSAQAPLLTRSPNTAPSSQANIYRDDQLCFTIDIPSGWKAYGEPGGFASFTSSDSSASFRMSNVDLGVQPTLDQALANVRRGSLGNAIQNITSLTISDQPRLLISLTKAEYTTLALVITPPCGGSRHALFIAGTNADQTQMKAFVNQLHLIQ